MKAQQLESTRTSGRDWVVAGLLIFILSAASYLLLAQKLGFTSDDWYLLYAGVSGGAAKFWDVFQIDRPFRAVFVGAVFNLFGLNAVLYNWLSFGLRVAGALVFFSLLRQAWPRQRVLNVALAVLFAVYPGWTDQIIPVDMQSHLLAVALMLGSLSLSLRALRSTKAAGWWLWVGLAVAAQVVGLLLMEYYIGLEGLRLALLAMLCFQGWSAGKLRLPRFDLRKLVLNELPYVLGAGAFLFWRMVLFNNTRAATDIGGMLSGLVSSPLMRGMWALVYLVQDFFSVTVLAWAVPLYQQAYNLRLRDSLVALALGAAMSLLLWAGLAVLRRMDRAPQSAPDSGEHLDTQDGLNMLWVGCLGILLALLPVTLGERHIIFPTYSRFSLPASAGAILVLGGVLAAFVRLRWRLVVPVLLAGMAVTANFANMVNFAGQWDTIREFWWQMSWRAPGIAPGTVLVADYHEVGTPEDYYIWGPANLAYYGQRYQVDGLDYTPLNAVLLTADNIPAIQAGRDLGPRERRGLTSLQDTASLLVLSMPQEGACVHAIDGRAPELSSREAAEIRLVAQASQLGLIDVEAAPPQLPAALFGSEPEHGWCYYYQKASLARQQQDWEQAARLGDEAGAANLRPIDWVEWMPFVQAYAYLGRYDQADAITPIIADVPSLKAQACQLFRADSAGYGAAYPEGQRYLQEKFCGQPANP